MPVCIHSLQKVFADSSLNLTDLTPIDFPAYSSIHLPDVESEMTASISFSHNFSTLSTFDSFSIEIPDNGWFHLQVEEPAVGQVLIVIQLLSWASSNPDSTYRSQQVALLSSH